MTLKFENPGYVYILSNESLKDLKIGYTQNSPYDRSFDLYTTGVPTPFFVEKFWFVEDAMLCEELIHTRLTRFRTNESREFFRVDLEKAVMAAVQAIDDMRERLWAKNAIKSNYKPNQAQNDMPDSARSTPAEKHNDEIIAAGLKPLVQQYSYNNPKFTEMMKTLKESKFMLTTEEIAKKIKISPKGVESLVKMMQSQQGAMLYTKEENKVKKYAMALSFNVHQLKMLSEKYPDLNLMSLESLFEKPAQSNKSGYKNNNGGKNYPPRKPANSGEPQKAAAPQSTQTAQQPRPAGDKAPASPAEFIQQKLNQESQQVAAQPRAAAPAKQLTDKEAFMKSCKDAYNDVIGSGKGKEPQQPVRKPIKP